MPQHLCLLGATGSIGDSTLAVVREHPQRFTVHAISAYHNLDKAYQLACVFSPAFLALASTENTAHDKKNALLLEKRLRQAGIKTHVLCHPNALCEIASLPEVDTVVAAIVGASGLKPTLAAVSAGKRVLLANKEALVMAGNLLLQTAYKTGAVILPLDSEHNAVFQCLPSGSWATEADINDSDHIRQQVRKIWLTASGGPFWQGFSPEDLQQVSVAQACAHPKWQMGRKISVDSATMMNKALEVIEAHWLFGLPARDIGVLIHPNSVVHSLVEYVDGSWLAQMGSPDMRTPIAHALAYPNRVSVAVAPLNLAQIGSLSFYEPDHQRFPALSLAYLALELGERASVWLNASNEEVVAAFLDEKCRFTDIAQVVATALAHYQQYRPQNPDLSPNDDELADIMWHDAAARLFAREALYALSDERLTSSRA